MSTRLAAAAAAPLVLLVLAACTSEPPPAAPAPEPAPTRGETREHMQEHFIKAIEAKEAVIGGRIEEVGPAMQWLSEHTEPGVPEPWMPYVQQMQVVATAGAQSTDLLGAGAAVAGLAEACGACHQALQGGPRFEVGDPPVAEPGDTRGHMARHQWAANRLWEGLVGPSDAAWSAGAQVLAQDASLWSGEHADLPEGVQELADQVHRVGAEAAAAATPDARASAYAELLVTCAACHSAVGRGPGNLGGDTP